MSIASQITALGNNIGAAYNMIGQRGGIVPARKNAENMATAIATIPSGGGGVGIPREISNNTFQVPSNSFTYTIPSGTTTLGHDALNRSFVGSGITSLDLSGVTTVEDYGLYGVCRECSSISSIDLADIVTVGNYGMEEAFRLCREYTGSIDLSSVTTIGTYGMAYAFAGCSKMTSLDMSGLVTLAPQSIYGSGYCLAYLCYQCSRLTSVDFSNLEYIEPYGENTLNSAFYGCYSLTNVNFSKLKYIKSKNAFQRTFTNCSGLTTADFSGLEEIGTGSATYVMQYAFDGCRNLTTVKFDNVKKILGNQPLSYAFKGCTSLTTLSFPSLSDVGTYTNQFNSMLSGCSGVTVHFPAAMQSTIGSWSSVTGGFGGRNTTVLFDL